MRSKNCLALVYIFVFCIGCSGPKQYKTINLELNYRVTVYKTKFMSVNYKGKKLIGDLNGVREKETCDLNEMSNGSVKIYYNGNFGEGEMYVKANCTEFFLSENYSDSISRDLNLRFDPQKN